MGLEEIHGKRRAVALWVAVFGAANACLLHLFNSRVREPYLDESVHVAQAQRFCAGDFGTWDPSISTLPGLHVMGAGFGRAVGGCMLGTLRALPALMSTGMLAVMYQIARQEHPHLSRPACLAKALAEATLPPLFFFAPMFYPDLGSTFFVMIMIHFANKNTYPFYVVSAFAGAASVLFKQTNVVWVVYAACTALLTRCRDQEARASPTMFARWSLSNIPQVTAVVWPYATVVISFASFVITNGSMFVAPGDRHGARPSVFNLMQLFYLLPVATVSLLPVVAAHIWDRRALILTRRHLLDNLVFIAILSVLASPAVFVSAAPSLADSRHYSHYIFGALGWSWWAPYAAMPLYALCAAVLWQSIGSQREPMWWVVFTGCCAASLVPLASVEIRHFVVPLLVLHSSVAPPDARSKASLVAHVVLSLLVNAAAFGVFMFQPFVWTDGTTARYVW
eukprot:m51a1_g7213 hypothetical protein (451) ;mRNA; f:229764-231307